MGRGTPAPIRCRGRDATVVAKVLFLSCLLIAPANAQSPVLRDVEVRSFLGEPLNLRIALGASTERATAAICQSVNDGDGRESALKSSDLRLTIVAVRDTRYLRIRGRAPFNDPVARFSLRIGCPGDPIVDREFTALIDPPPFTALPLVRVAVAATAVAPATAPTKKAPAAEKPDTRPAPPTAAKSTPSVPLPAPVAMPAPAKPVEPQAARSATDQTAAAKPASGATAMPRAAGFQLRLSGSAMDLSRSRNVTDEQRSVLREKQLMLDADDQVAALLSLRNTVKQLEQRLNDLQLRMASTTSAPSAPPPPVAQSTPTVTPRTSAPAATSAPSVAAPVIASATPEPTPAPAPPAIETRPAPVKAAPEKPVPAEASIAATLENFMPSPLMAGGVVAALLALAAAWAWSRRDRPSYRGLDSPMPHATTFGKAPRTAAKAPHATQRPVSETPPRDPEQSAAANPPPEEAPGDRFARTSRNAAADVAADAAGHRVAATTAAAHDQVDAPVIFDDTPASYELDSRPATTVDFLVGMDEKLPEDRVRRLQYMHERYPELKTNAISIDDADSVINAARLYFDEADKGNGREKASELLTFAVEERPQEIRFWLAQFEIFRLENMVAEFNALAGKFHVLFSHAPAWPKVRQIGHELDPANPLYAASGSSLLAGEARFEPIAENWLNAPMDFTSDALMSDLRLALLDDHGVGRGDFESITARLTTSAGTA